VDAVSPHQSAAEFNASVDAARRCSRDSRLHDLVEDALALVGREYEKGNNLKLSDALMVLMLAELSKISSCVE